MIQEVIDESGGDPIEEDVRKDDAFIKNISVIHDEEPWCQYQRNKWYSWTYTIKHNNNQIASSHPEAHQEEDVQMHFSVFD